MKIARATGEWASPWSSHSLPRYPRSMEDRAWVSAYRYTWTPVLTFTRRHLHLLDWIDAHLTPIAFRDEPEQIGVAVGHIDARVEVDRDGMTVRTPANLDEGGLLPELVAGVLEVMEPRNVRHRTYSALWSFALANSDYDESRSEYARDITFGHASSGGFIAVDGSSLVDLESTDWRGQVEFGVVSDAELVERLNSPESGRMTGRSRWDSPVDLPDTDQLPSASLLADVMLVRRNAGTVSTAADVMTTMSDAASAGASLVAMMKKKFNAGGEGDEFAQAE